MDGLLKIVVLGPLFCVEFEIALELKIICTEFLIAVFFFILSCPRFDFFKIVFLGLVFFFFWQYRFFYIIVIDD